MSNSTPISFNKICQPEDWEIPELRAWMGLLHDERNRDLIERGILVHRKDWEHAMALHALTQVGALSPSARALGTGCGHEAFLYRLAHHCSEVVATDLYGETSFSGDEADPSVLAEPERFAPFDYPHERLRFQRADALALDFADSTFDISFSFSAIEHYGGDHQTQLALAEMARVTRPGGYIALASEFVVKGERPDFYDHQRFFKFFSAPAGLEMVGHFDDSYQIQKPRQLRPSLIERVRQKIANNFGHHPEFPHIFVTERGAIWTSFHVLYRKC